MKQSYMLRTVFHVCADPSRQAIEEYFKEMHSVFAKILELLLSSCLKSTQAGARRSCEFLDADGLQVFRASYYDTCPQPEMVMGMRSHVDSSLLTAILQDDTSGLQVEKDGQWYGVAPYTRRHRHPHGEHTPGKYYSMHPYMHALGLGLW